MGREAMGNHWVAPLDACGDWIVVPQQEALRASFGARVEHKTHACIVALVLDAVQSPTLALKAHAAGFAQADPVQGAGGAAGKRLGHYGVQRLSPPRN